MGERLYRTAPFGQWGTQTFVAGLTQDALIAPWGINGAMDGLAFDTYVETRLAPAPDPGTVVILDNPFTHKSPRAAQALKKRGCWFLFLPPADVVLKFLASLLDDLAGPLAYRPLKNFVAISCYAYDVEPVVKSRVRG